MATRDHPDNSAAPPHPAPRNRATVAKGFVVGMLAGTLQAGGDPAALLAATGIDLADPATRIPVDRYAALYNLINLELDDEGFGLFSRPLPCGTFEFLCRGMVTAPNLAEALTRARRFLRIVLPDLVISVHRERGAAELRISESRRLATQADDPARVFAFEWLLRLIHGLASWLVGRGLALDSVSFPYNRPLHADDYALIYTENSSFGSAILTARFNANLLDLPIRRDEAALTAFLEEAPGKLTTLYRRDREMVQRVRDLVRSALPNPLSLEDVADHLHLSPRTVHRRLEEEGSSFRAIKDALRRDMALARLAKTGDPVSRVASDLGYADTSAFYRAFVEWTGMAPAHYRRQLSAGQH